MDIYHEAEWTAMDIEDLRAVIEHGRSSRRRPNFYAARAPWMKSPVRPKNLI